MTNKNNFSNNLLEKYFEITTRNSIYSSKKDLKFYLDNLYGNFDFQQKTMLDIGGGNGIFSFYAAGKGTNQSIILEPLFEGSDKKTEDACMNLTKDDAAKDKYNSLFTKLFKLAKPGVKLIITDCSNRNFFADLNIKNPFAPTIEWEKHKAPEVWLKLLENAGFRKPIIKWLSFRQLRRSGQILAGNKIISYFLNSHFLLWMTRV